MKQLIWKAKVDQEIIFIDLLGTCNIPMKSSDFGFDLKEYRLHLSLPEFGFDLKEYVLPLLLKSQEPFGVRPWLWRLVVTSGVRSSF